MPGAEANSDIIRRKPRIVGYRKVLNKIFRSSSNYIFPTIRYGKYYLYLFSLYISLSLQTL